MRLERRLRTKTAIDMTPLIDVIMQLIIFFMITTTFKTLPGIELALPSSSTARPVPQEELHVLVASAEDIRVGEALTDLEGLPAAVASAVTELRSAAAAAAGNPSTATSPGTVAPARGKPSAPRAVVEARADLDYQLIVSVLDALRRNGIEAVGLATATEGARRGK